MMRDIHAELETDLEQQATQLGEVARYYFDGAGKAVRPVIAVCLGKAALKTTGVANNCEVEGKQRKVALVSEMIHTASLLHDDILDHALTRRGKPSVNSNWDARKSTFAGDYILAVGSRLMAEIESAEVTVVLSQVKSVACAMLIPTLCNIRCWLTWSKENSSSWRRRRMRDRKGLSIT